jgi:hypothetical protein
MAQNSLAKPSAIKERGTFQKVSPRLRRVEQGTGRSGCENYTPEKKRPPKGPEGHSLSCTSLENARRKFAACEALLAAVKIALSSSLRREIHEAM